MNNYSLDEITEIINNQGYKYVSLTDQFGKELIPFNSRNSVAERLEEIKLRFNSPALKNGLYLVKAKNSVQKTAAVDDFPILKGTVENLSEPKKEIVIQQNISPEILTYQEALKMQVTIKELEMKVQQLEKENKELILENTELQAELENTATLSEDQPEQKSMVETAKDFLSELMTFGAPLLDKHFQLKERQLEIEAAKYLPKQQQKPADPNKEMLKVREWILSKKDQPEVYNALAAIFQNSNGDVSKFCQLVSDYNLELLEELTHL